MIYKSLIFENDFIQKLTDEVIETRIDDYYINYYLRKKKKKWQIIIQIILKKL